MKNMNSNNRKKLNKAVKILNNLHFKSSDIMLVGSVALDMQGMLPYSREAHDVDFIIRMSDQDWRCLKLIEAIYNENVPTTYYPGDGGVIFDFAGIRFNIWKACGDEKLTGLKDEQTGVFVKAAGNILKVKKSYSRDKDLIDLYKISKNII